MKMKKICGAFISSMLLMILCAFPAMASEIPEGTGSITISLEDTKDHCPKADVHIIVAKIAELKDGEYVLHNRYVETGINLNHMQNANELASAAEKLEHLKPEGIEVITDDDGETVIRNLSVGMYLVYACDTAEYGNIMPAFVPIPMWNETEGNMEYAIKILPKHAPDLESPDTPQTGDRKHASLYGRTAVGAFLLAIICFGLKRKKVELYKKSKM